jgi:branched-chain amino acid aminotransferase
VFFVYDDGTLVTPPLTGAILPGITRDSVITLARHAGRTVIERPVSFADWQADAQSGKLREVFACGTAAVITPIGRVRFPEGEFAVAGGAPGEVTMGLRQQLVDIQRGRGDDPFGWVRRVL